MDRTREVGARKKKKREETPGTKRWWFDGEGLGRFGGKAFPLCQTCSGRGSRLAVDVDVKREGERGRGRGRGAYQG